MTDRAPPIHHHQPHPVQIYCRNIEAYCPFIYGQTVLSILGW